MKKEYSEPEAKVVKFNVRDIVITSGDMTSDLTSEEGELDEVQGQQ